MGHSTIEQVTNDAGSSNPQEDATWQTEAPTLSHRVAASWLEFLYWGAASAPTALRLSTPFWVRAAWLASPQLRARLLANAKWLLGQTAGERDRRILAQSVLRHCIGAIHDIGSAQRKSVEQVQASIESVSGQAHYESVRSRQGGLIVATAHLGSFEIGIAALRRFESRIRVVFQQDRSNRFNQLRRALHQKWGLLEEPVDGWSTWVKLRDAIHDGDAVLIQVDRVMAGQSGVKVPFCGGHILMAPGAAKLAGLTGAPILPVFVVRRKHGSARLAIEKPIRVRQDRLSIESATFNLAKIVERHVRAHPGQWMMLDRMWCEDLEGEES